LSVRILFHINGNKARDHLSAKDMAVKRRASRNPMAMQIRKGHWRIARQDLRSLRQLVLGHRSILRALGKIDMALFVC
jgi:hypothetical protein